MAEPSRSSSSSTKPFDKNISTIIRNILWAFKFLIITIILPCLIAIIIYQLASFDAGEYPIHELIQNEQLFIPKRNGHMLQGLEKIGIGKLLGPEDIAYDEKTGFIYTGCVDGWVKRVKVTDSVADSVLEDWVNTGGRPLGLVHGHHGEVIVADAYKGLLNITADGEIHLLTNEAEGLKFKLTDDLDIASNGIIYFSDASYKYNINEFILDHFEGRQYGRLLSYNPSTKQTTVLLKDLYFANGVAVSPDQKSVIVCESPLRRCKKYYLEGEKKGSFDMFIANLPGLPDNIQYAGDGNYYIALATEVPYGWDEALRSPFIRKVLAMIVKFIGLPHMEKNGGALVVDLEGNSIAHYYDPGLSIVTSSIRIGDYLYCGSVANPYIIRLNITQYPAVADM